MSGNGNKRAEWRSVKNIKGRIWRFRAFRIKDFSSNDNSVLKENLPNRKVHSNSTITARR